MRNSMRLAAGVTIKKMAPDPATGGRQHKNQVDRKMPHFFLQVKRQLPATDRLARSVVATRSSRMAVSITERAPSAAISEVSDRRAP